MKMHIDTLLRTLVIKGASDLHLQADSPPFLRIHGEITLSNLERLSSEDIEKLVYSIMDEEQKQKFKKNHQLCLSYSMPEICRFRINVFRQRGSIGAAIRVIPLQIPTIDELELPPIVKELISPPQGLVLVTGPAGSGKTTTLAAMIDYINTTRRAHIMTIEDPIEFFHSNKSCLVNQRCLDVDAESFAIALKDVLREDPDVILVGEMRDLETISWVIAAAEAGHLVFTTLHTSDAVETVDRIVNAFPPDPPDQRSEIRRQLSLILRGVIYQTLLRKKDGSGRVAAFEIMLVNSTISKLIKEDKIDQIYSAIQTSDKVGEQLLGQSLKDLCQKGIISLEEAKNKARDPKALE